MNQPNNMHFLKQAVEDEQSAYQREGNAYGKYTNGREILNGYTPDQIIQAMNTAIHSIAETGVLNTITHDQVGNFIVSLRNKAHQILQGQKTVQVSVHPPLFLGKYEVGEKLGEGGMGSVYKAFDRKLKRYVAIKVLNEKKVEQRMKKRFLREAEIMAKLDHPGIVKIYDINEKGIVLEFVDGETFSNVIDQAGKRHDRMHFVEKNLIKFVDMVKAMSYAHGKGIVHRDIKPENIMLTKDEKIKVMDFGIAKAKNADNTQLTKTREIVGTPHYMAPEQATGDKIRKNDMHLQDQYALGVILYEFLTGKRPIDGDGSMQILFAKTQGNITHPQEHVGNIPDALSTICLKSLSLKPKNRYNSLLEMQEDLEAYINKKKLVHAKQNKVLELMIKNKILLMAGGVIFLLVILSIFQSKDFENKQKNTEKKVKKIDTSQKQEEKIDKKKQLNVVKVKGIVRDSNLQALSLKCGVKYNYLVNNLSIQEEALEKEGWNKAILLTSNVYENRTSKWKGNVKNTQGGMRFKKYGKDAKYNFLELGDKTRNSKESEMKFTHKIVLEKNEELFVVVHGIGENAEVILNIRDLEGNILKKNTITVGEESTVRPLSLIYGSSGTEGPVVVFLNVKGGKFALDNYSLYTRKK